MTESVQPENKKKDFGALIIIVLLLIVLILLFLLSPLKELVFPSTVEPELTLAVVESSGPDTATGLYRVVVEAIVEGKPEPQVTFNRNDGVGELETNQTLIMLAEEENFLLKAVASNPHGTAEAELELYTGIMVATRAGSDDISTPADPDSNDALAPGNGEADRNHDADPSDPSAPPAPEGGSSGNRTPRITEIVFLGDDISGRLNQSIPLRYEEAGHVFSILVTDADDDEIELQVQPNQGRINSINPGMWLRDRPENMRSFFFEWQSPANPPGNLDTLNVQLAVTALDPSGASDRKVIKIALRPEPEDAGSDPGEIRRVRTVFVSVAATADLSGTVTSAGDVMLGDILVGDNLLNRQFKGFLNFPLITLRNQITDIVGDSDYTISNARLVFSNINKVGNPEGMASLVDFKVIHYGSSLNAAAFAPGGKHIFNRATSTFNTAGGQMLSLSSSTFTNELIDAINARSKTMQIKLGLNVATNNNNADDFFRFPCNTASIVLTIEY